MSRAWSSRLRTLARARGSRYCWVSAMGSLVEVAAVESGQPDESLRLVDREIEVDGSFEHVMNNLTAVQLVLRFADERGIDLGPGGEVVEDCPEPHPVTGRDGLVEQDFKADLERGGVGQAI